MIEPKYFYQRLKDAGIGLFAGVPDSLLKDFCAYIDDHGKPTEHIITANEGNAIALAAGYHLSSSKIAAVYMQNSGLGNAINPLTSLTDQGVYSIPMLMIIGWRGEPNVKDEPQHIKQGAITPQQLELLGVPYWILDADSPLKEVLKQAFNAIEATSAPVALLIRKNTFSSYKSHRVSSQKYQLKREDALRAILECTGEDLIVSTTGKTSREVFELRKERNEIQRDFLTVGAMGHTSSIALGVALGSPEKRIVCIDGDGSALMHLGAMPIIGDIAPANLIHIVLNNAAHESVGGQPTVGDTIDFKAIVQACQYKTYLSASSVNEIKLALKELRQISGPSLLEIKITTGSRADLGRPTSTPLENKMAFMQMATHK